jgi:hypothetical protein
MLATPQLLVQALVLLEQPEKVAAVLELRLPLLVEVLRVRARQARAVHLRRLAQKHLRAQIDAQNRLESMPSIVEQPPDSPAIRALAPSSASRRIGFE